MNFLKKLGLLLGLGAILCLVFQTALAQTESGKSVGKPLASLSGIDTQITNEMCLLIRGQEDWDEIWQRHLGRSSTNETESKQMLEVDFKKCVVVAVFGGKMFNCSGVSLYSLSEEPDRILFRNKLNYYQASGTPGQKIIPRSTYGFFVLQRTDKHLVVERAVPRKKGQEYVFESQARFERTGHTFGIYLTDSNEDSRLLSSDPGFGIDSGDSEAVSRIVESGEGDWSKLRLYQTPIISKRDILSYYFTNHTMRITAEAAARIPSPPVRGRPFVVVVDGQKVYLGVFTTTLSSFACLMPSICVDREGRPKLGDERTLTIDRSYPRGDFGKDSDPRADVRIWMSLK